MSIRPLDIGFREDVDRRAKALLFTAVVLSIAGALLHRLPAVCSYRSWLIAPLEPALSLVGAVRSSLAATLLGSEPVSGASALETIEAAVARERAAALQEELNELREVSGLPAILPFEGVLCEVTGHVTGPDRRILLLDRGTRSGVRVGGIVLGAAGGRAAVVGRVVEAGPTVSKVMTTLDPSCRIAARLGDQGGFVYGGAAGQSAGRLEYVPRDASVAPGDEVLTSEDGTIFPGGYLIGRVKSLGAEGAVFHDVRVEPAVPLDRLRYVWVGKREQS